MRQDLIPVPVQSPLRRLVAVPVLLGVVMALAACTTRAETPPPAAVAPHGNGGVVERVARDRLDPLAEWPMNLNL